MNIFSKKIIACILTLIMCISSVAFVGAADSDVINISATETTTINTAADMTGVNGVANHNSTGNYAFCTNAYVTTTIDVEETGYYNVEVTGITRSAKYSEYNLLVDDELADSFRIWGNNGDLYTIDVADLYLTEGIHELKLAYVAPASVYNYLTEIKLTKKANDFDAIWVQAKTGTSLGNSGAAHEMFYVSVGGSVSYTVNAPAAGTYKMSMKVARVDAATANYTVAVNDKAVEGTMGELPANNSKTEPYYGLQVMANMCDVELIEGENTITFTNNGSFMYFSYFKFDKIEENSEETEEPIGERIRIPMKSFVNSSSLTPDDLVSFEQGKWAEFDIDIEKAGVYQFGAKFGGLTGSDQTFKVYINDVEQLNETVEVENDFFAPGDAVIGEITFATSGKNTLKIENTVSSGLFVEDLFIQLVSEEMATPEPSDEPTDEPTEEPTEEPDVEPMGENIRIHMRDYVKAYRANGGSSELGQDGANPDNTLWQIKDWAEYALNITTPGTYEFGLCMAGPVNNPQSISVEINGTVALVATENTTNTSDYRGHSDVVFGNLSFPTPGVYTIKVAKTDGSFVYSSHVFLNLTDSSEIRTSMGSYKEANSTKVSGALDYEGGNYCFRPGDWAKYNVYIATPGKYKLGIKESGQTGDISKLRASVNGVEQFNNNGKTALSGMWTEFSDIEYGVVTFTYEGTNELLLENTGSSAGEYVKDFYLVLVEELDAGTSIPDVPKTKEIRLHMANDSYEKYCNLTGANDLKIEGGCVTWHGKGDSSTVGDWAKFKVNIEDAGLYRFGMEISGTVGANTALRVEIDDEEKIPSTAKTITSYYGNLTDTVFGTLEFEEPGEYTLYVEHTGSAGQYVGDIFLTHLGNTLEIIDVKAGDIDLTQESIIPVGTDIFMVSFSKLIKNSDVIGKNCKISLTDSTGKEIAINPSVVKGTAVIALKEALKLDEEYILSVDAISDSIEYSTSDPAEYRFTTQAGEAQAFIREASAQFEKNIATVKAIMFSAQNIGIKGRSFEAYLKDTHGNVSDKPVISDFSGEDGVIEFTYSLPEESSDGKYTFVIKGEYVSSDVEVSAVYVSDDLKITIANEINEASTSEEVKTLIEKYSEYLGVELSSLLTGLTPSDVYKHFIEDDIVFEEIVTSLEKFVAIEKLLQTTETGIDDILNNGEIWNSLGMDKSMYDILPDSEKSAVKNAVLEINNDVTANEFLVEFNEIIQESLRNDNSKVALTPDVDDSKVYTGQGIYLPVVFKEDYQNLKKLTYKISVEDDEILKNSDVKLNVPAVVTKTVEGNVMMVEITFDTTVSNKKAGNIILTAPVSTGIFDITLEGDVEYLFEKGDISFIIEGKMNKKSIEIEVVKTPSNSSGSSSSSSNSSYKPSGGGNSSSTPVVTPSVTEKFAFTDIASNHWAYPAVTYLLDCGVIEKTANKLYNPEVAISREEIVKMLVVALNLVDTTAESKLSDVSKDNPYYVYIASAEKHGIIYGNDLGQFMLGSQITREDICVILHRAVNSKIAFSATGELFADDSIISDYAKKAVYEMRGFGLINGMGDNQFAPKGAVTKAQAAKMIYEIVKAVAK